MLVLVLELLKGLLKMRSYPFMQVDAFTTRALGGNPCAIVLEADDLNGEEMQAIAQEQNLSETAFVLRSRAADVGARYFTPLSEIPLAGHPTIATIHALVETGRIPVRPPRTTIQLELPAGIIPVEIFGGKSTPEQVVMTQLKPQFLAKPSALEVCAAFGLSADALHPTVPAQVVSTGTPQLMVCVTGATALRRIAVDYRILAALSAQHNFFSAHLFFVREGRQSTFARHFAPEFEDPFTGSATGGMGAFLWRYGLLSQRTFCAEQGHWMGRPGTASVEVVGPRDDILAVKVGGSAITVIRGTLSL